MIISFSSGTEGYEAAPVNQGTAEWGCDGIDITGADGTDIYSGSANTTDILAGCVTSAIAARIAGNYSLNGFNNWFLPSKDQLNELYLQRDLVGGFVSLNYWASSEIDDLNAWDIEWASGFWAVSLKSITNGVRAIRAF